MNDPWLPYSRGRHAHPVPGAPALSSEKLSVCCPGTDRLVLRDVSVQISLGARAATLGPNGAGKSTLLKAVAGLLPIARGNIRI
jgi:ABC-type Mn2+/Zn2+ transport system ATPase subunit